MTKITDLAYHLKATAQRYPDARHLFLVLTTTGGNVTSALMAISETETRRVDAGRDMRDMGELVKAVGQEQDGVLVALYDAGNGDVHIQVSTPSAVPERPLGHLAVPVPGADAPLVWVDMGRVREEGGDLVIEEPEMPPWEQLTYFLAEWRPLVDKLREVVPHLTPRTPEAEGIAITSLAVRWSYLAALINEPVPPWNEVGFLSPRITDPEMRRLNIEISHALTGLFWMRNNRAEDYYSLLTAVRLFLPVAVDADVLRAVPMDERSLFEEQMAPVFRAVTAKPSRKSLNAFTLWAWRNRDRLEDLHSQGHIPARPGTRCLRPRDAGRILADVARRVMLVLEEEEKKLSLGNRMGIMTAMSLQVLQTKDWETRAGSAPICLAK